MARTVKYYDMHGEEIMEGMYIQHEEGETELVYLCGEDGDDLGINASNEVWLERQYGSAKELYREFYPLHQFNTKEWEIIE